MHSETRTQAHAAGYARVRYIQRECRSFLSLVPRLHDSLTRSLFIYLSRLFGSRARVFFLFLILLELEYSDSAYISGTPSIPPLHSSLFIRFLYALPLRLLRLCLFFFLLLFCPLKDSRRGRSFYERVFGWRIFLATFQKLRKHLSLFEFCILNITADQRKSTRSWNRKIE